MNKTIFTVLVILVTSMDSFSQEADVKKIENAFKNGDIETIVSYAPGQGTLQFSSPLQPQEKGIEKNEFRHQIELLFKDKKNFKYRQLFSESQEALPSLVVGKIESNDQSEYIMMGLASFGTSNKFLYFAIMEALPPKMRALDK